MGSRSNGPIRVAMYGSSNTSYQSTANDEVLCLPMIETKSGVENLEAILDVPGVAGVCGCFDLLLEGLISIELYNLVQTSGPPTWVSATA
jgi:2-keto-3-deoxy-L-rhamnonate aldolase RhmA